MTERLDDSALLDRFARGPDEDAFAALVGRYVDLVYSMSRRELSDPAAAEDATQQVFLLLASKAAALRGTQLSAWLFKTTRYVCANARRKAARRRSHEQKAAQMRPETSAGGPDDSAAWGEIAPLLESAIDSLPRAERNIVLARYFERRSFKEVGQQFQISEEAARKRVDRATDKLRAFFARAGVATLPAGAALESVLIERAVTDAPAALAKLIAAHMVAAAPPAVGGLAATLKWGTFMASATGKKVAVAALVLVLLGGTTAVVIPAANRWTDVAPRPLASGGGGKQIAVPPAALSVTTKGGVLVEFLGVSNATKGLPWWDANGRRAATQPFTTRDSFRDSHGDYLAGYELDQQFEVAVRARYATPRPGSEVIFLQPVFTPSVDRQAWETPREDLPSVTSEPGLARIQVAFARPVPASCRVVIGVASGPWQTIAESTTPLTQTTFTPRADKPKAKLTMQPLRPEDPKNNPSYPASTRPARPGQPPATLPAYSELTVTYPMSLWSYEVDRPETRIVAVVNGSEVPSEGRRTSGSGTTWDETVAFKAAPEAVQAVRFQARPYEPVVFDNISLRPNVQTAPTVTLKNVGEPLSQPAAKR